MNQGKLVIVFIFGLSTVMGGYAWWHHYTLGKRCLELWGAEAGELIRYAPQVEVMQLETTDSADAVAMQIQDQSVKIVARKDITDTPGLVHGRHALIVDASFIWNEELAEASNWQYLLRFTDGDQQVNVAFDCDRGRVRLVGTDRQATLQPHQTTGYRTRLPMWLGRDTNSSQTAEPASADTP